MNGDTKKFNLGMTSRFVTNVIVFCLYFGIIVFLTVCLMLIRLVVVALTENTKLI